MHARRLCLASLLCCAAAPLSLAQEWTRFRGPDGGGINDAATVPATWDASDVNWMVKLPGVGHSSPVVWGDKVFVTCADEQSGTRTLACLAAGDGSTVWKRDYTADAYRHHGENSYASSSPAVDGDHVYFCLMSPRELKIVALKHDGTDAWSTPLGPFVTQHGGGHSPVVYGGLVIVANEQDGPGSCLVALDRERGNVRWTTPRKSYRFSASTPCVFRPAGGKEQLVFTSWAHGMTGVNPADGAILWECADAFDARTVGSPVAANDAGLVMAGCGEGQGGHWLVAVRPPKEPGGKAEVAYKLAKNAPYVPTPLVQGDRLFYLSDSGVMTCAKASTGETVWQERVPGGYFASPVLAGDKIFCVSKRGDVVALAASDKFELLGKTELGEKSHATPAVSGGRMYVRTYGQLISVGGTK